MTYLNIMNNVLRRLREEEVNSVNDSTYSKMAGDFINDAKTIVEQAADWSALRSSIDVVAGFYLGDDFLGSTSAVITNSGDDAKILSAYISSENIRLEYQTKDWFIDNLDLGPSPYPQGIPRYYTFNGINADEDTQIRVYPQPDARYVISFDLIKRQNELTNDADVLKVPSKPVIHLAVALLARERGETGGTSTAEYFSIADKYLSDAIAIDAAKHPEEMVFRTI